MSSLVVYIPALSSPQVWRYIWRQDHARPVVARTELLNAGPVSQRLHGVVAPGESRTEAQDATTAWLPGVPMRDEHTKSNWLQSLVRADPDVVHDAMRVTVWGRWFLLLVVFVLTVYRPGHEGLAFPDPHLALHALMNVLPLVFNGLVHYRLLTKRPVTWRWMLGLGAMDIALTTSYIASHHGFQDFAFLGYYPALGAFAMVFSSFRFIVAWVTAAAAVYTFVSVTTGLGLDLSGGDDKELVARLAMMYLTAVTINLIVRLERTRREAATARERQAHRERIELSQSIHDTTAQTAYMIGLGIEGALKLAGDSNPKLVERLEATAALSRSAMWELRRPIDLGRLVDERDLGSVLDSHTARFARITSVPAEMVQSGEEPALATEVRTGLFSIAHNALANAFLHAEAAKVEVRLDFGDGGIRLSVSDDGVGLPEDYAERGRGFAGMEADAERMGGRLIVESGGPGGGTTITCVVPNQSARGE